MFKLMKKRIKNEKGLTLVEVLAVVVILAIIAAIAIPAIGNIINSSRDKAQASDALNIIAGAKIAHVETGCGDDGTGCTKANGDLANYVDGVDIDGITVQLNPGKDADAVSGWAITGYEFKFKTKEFTDAVTNHGDKTKYVSETDLKTVLGEE